MTADPQKSLSPYAGLASQIRPQGSTDARAYAAERASRPPVVRVALVTGNALLRPFTEPCQVLVDGRPVGIVSSHQKFESAIAAGEHRICVAAGRLRSNVVAMDVENGDIAQYVCAGHNSLLDFMFGLTALYIIAFPHRFFWIKSFHR
jgi:hypothetical protein